MRARGSWIDRRQFLLALSTASTIAATFQHESKVKPPPLLNLNPFLEPLRATGKVPALAAALVLEGKLRGVGAVGIRKGGSPTPVKGTDLWHIGSCAKMMTATLAGLLVDQRKIQWDTTIGETFLDLRDDIHAAYRDVTLAQLLTHRAGLPQQPDTKAWDEAWAQRGTPTEQRLEFVRATLAREPESTPNTRFNYSNQSYAIAGAMLERETNQTWETLMRDHLFKAIFMNMSGFGMPGTVGQIDQPWGHRWRNGKLEPQQLDNPPAIYPAAGVNCSIYDFARFAIVHLTQPRLLKPATWARLHTPPAGQEYAMGWNRLERDWAQGHVLTHSGSNTLNMATIWIAPKMKFAAVVTTNIGGESGEKVCDETVQALIKEHILKEPASD